MFTQKEIVNGGRVLSQEKICRGLVLIALRRFSWRREKVLEGDFLQPEDTAALEELALDCLTSSSPSLTG